MTRKSKNCPACALPNVAELNRDLRADPHALDLWAHNYGIAVPELIAHAGNCLRESVRRYLESVDGDIARLTKISKLLEKKAGADAFFAKEFRAYVKQASDLRHVALECAGVQGKSHVDAVRSPGVQALLRALTLALSAPQFGPDYLALNEVQRVLRRAMGEAEDA
jgi:hypothetical protein